MNSRGRFMASFESLESGRSDAHWVRSFGGSVC